MPPGFTYLPPKKLTMCRLVRKKVTEAANDSVRPMRLVTKVSGPHQGPDMLCLAEEGRLIPDHNAVKQVPCDV